MRIFIIKFGFRWLGQSISRKAIGQTKKQNTRYGNIANESFPAERHAKLSRRGKRQLCIDSNFCLISEFFTLSLLELIASGPTRAGKAAQTQIVIEKEVKAQKSLDIIDPRPKVMKHQFYHSVSKIVDSLLFVFYSIDKYKLW